MAQIVDPGLIADIVKQLNVKGPLAPFEIAEVAVPVFDIGQLTGLDINRKVTTPASADAVRVGTNNQALLVGELSGAAASLDNNGVLINPGVAAIFCDTGQLNQENTRINCWVSSDIVGMIWQVAWRNAADSSTIATIQILQATPQPFFFTFMAFPLVNERIQIRNTNAETGNATATIQAIPMDRAGA